MGIVLNSLYRFSEKDKQEILGDLTPPMPTEDIMAEFREMFQKFTETINGGFVITMNAQREEFTETIKSQEEEIRELRENVAYLVKMSQYQYRQYELLREELISHSPKDTEIRDNTVQHNENKNSKSVVPKESEAKNNPSAKPKPAKKVDRSKFRPLLDGKKEVREIPESWKDIIASIDDGTYREKYKIGNFKSLDLGSEGIIRMQIAGFDAEPLADGSGRAAITWIAMDSLKTKQRMNSKLSILKNTTKAIYSKSTGTIGGWGESEMKKFIVKEIEFLFPVVVKRSIKKVKKYTLSFDNYSVIKPNKETIDSLWIPSYEEVFGDYLEESSAPYYSALFSDKEERKRLSWWWLRSANSNSNFYGVSSNGNKANNSSEYYYDIVIGFCT